MLAFVTNFIPNIGFAIGVIPPALIAFLDSGVGPMIAVIIVYSVINLVIQSVIQPRVVGDKVGLSPTLTYLSVVFWTWVIGPLGALLAVPLGRGRCGLRRRGTASRHRSGPTAAMATGTATSIPAPGTSMSQSPSCARAPIP